MFVTGSVIGYLFDYIIKEKVRDFAILVQTNLILVIHCNFSQRKINFVLPFL